MKIKIKQLAIDCFLVGGIISSFEEIGVKITSMTTLANILILEINPPNRECIEDMIHTIHLKYVYRYTRELSFRHCLLEIVENAE